MNHRERVLAALNHQEPDLVPLDFGSARFTTITEGAYRALTSYLGIVVEPTILEKPQRTVHIDEPVLQRLDIDTRGIFLGRPSNWEDVQIDEYTYKDEWGVERSRPPESIYWDLAKSPLAGEITLADVGRWRGPDPDDPGRTRGLRELALRYRETTGCALVLALPTGFVHVTQFLRGFEDWFADLILSPSLLGALMDNVLEIQLAIIGHALDQVGDLVDVIACSDDIGHQRGPAFSPEVYRRLIKPRHQRMFQFMHDRSPAKLLYHSCGSVYVFLDDLVEIGVDILNPVQVSAAHMETDRLKREFGEKLVFWGGIDTQQVLPQGSAEDVRNEVQRRLSDLAAGGGYVLNSVHNIQNDVPPENVCAMFEAARELGRYPLK